MLKEKKSCNGGGCGYVIVRGEEELLARLEDGYELIRELANNRFLLKAP
ncbi:MAG: hypothetical protein QXK89_10160 [Candidatus Bathyarchaeia archaeon]